MASSEADAKKGEPEYWYSHQGVLKALAALARRKERDAAAYGEKYTINDMIDDLCIVRDKAPWKSRDYTRSETSGKSHGHVRHMVDRYKDVLAAYRDHEARRLRRGSRRPKVAKGVAVKV